ncbi:uncharacterized protein VTP21DRAFT_6931 [Calcarisporiella thermophila]|uniref:uncharacterized protein n=1 Tax=Calcarisporiella thermophila TaxID=911321 RepID=UPI003742E19C
MVSTMKVKKSLLEQLADFESTAPKEHDPEDIDAGINASGSEAEDAAELGRDHYIAVGKSKLRQGLEHILDDPKYEGKRKSRREIFEDSWDYKEDDEDEDELNNAGGYGINTDEVSDEESLDEEEEEIESEDDNEGSDDEEDGSEEESDDEEGDQSESDIEDDLEGENAAAALHKAEEEERDLLRTISQNAENDVEKGNHVKQQIGMWDTLLDFRIRIQKSVQIANQLPQYDVYPEYRAMSEDVEAAIAEARAEVCSLLDSLLRLREDLTEENEAVRLEKRKRPREDDPDATAKMDVEELWASLKGHHDAFLPYRDETLEKWSNKVQIASGIPLNKKFKAINQSIHFQIQQVMADRERLIKRTQLKRAEYTPLGYKPKPVPATTNDAQLSTYDPECFDDTDFYQQMLRELIESRMVDAGDDLVAQGMRWAALRQARAQKQRKVDTKASKGRRLRYHVHEKLQSFMAPVPAGTWHEEMVEELYASLLGQNGERLDARGAQAEEEPQEAGRSTLEGPIEPNGLKIFG